MRKEFKVDGVSDPSRIWKSRKIANLNNYINTLDDAIPINGSGQITPVVEVWRELRKERTR